MAFVLDTFTDSNGTLLQNHTPDVGGAPTALDNEFRFTSGSTQNAEINTNRVRSTSSTGTASRGYRYPDAPAAAEYDITADFIIGLDDNGASMWFLGARITPTGTGFGDVSLYFAGYEGHSTASSRKWVIAKRVAPDGIRTTLAEAFEDVPSGTYAVRFEVRDGTQKLFVDGVEKLSANDNEITQIGRVGLQCARHGLNVNAIDNFEAADVAAGAVEAEVAQIAPVQTQVVQVEVLSEAINDPTDIADLGLWLDASQITGLNDNDPVTTWSDESGAARHFTQGTAASRPIYRTNRLNGLPALDFDGVDDRLEGNAASLDLFRNLPGGTIFAVVRSDVDTVGTRYFFAASTNAVTSSNRAGAGANSVGGQWLAGGRRLDSDSLQTVSGGSVDTAAWERIAGKFDWSNADLFLYEDGVEVASKLDFQTAGNTSNTDSLGTRVGSIASDVLLWDGEIAEIIVYRRALTEAEFQDVDDYLVNKWFIPSVVADIAQVAPAKTQAISVVNTTEASIDQTVPSQTQVINAESIPPPVDVSIVQLSPAQMQAVDVEVLVVAAEIVQFAPTQTQAAQVEVPLAVEIVQATPGQTQVVQVEFIPPLLATGPFPDIDYYQVILVGKAGVGGKVIELPRSRVTDLSWELNGAGIARITMPTSDAMARELLLVEREVQIWRKGSLIWWGVPWRVHADIHNHFFSCEGLWSYFSRRFIEEDHQFINVDQFVIVWNLLNGTQQASDFADFGITSSPFFPSGVSRDRTYNKDEHRNLAEIASSFTRIINGFDFSIETFGDGRREWTPYYPSKGSYKPKLALEWGGNIINYRYKRDATRLLTKAIFRGEGEGPGRVSGEYLDTVASLKYGYFVQPYSDLDVSDQATLIAKAEAVVRSRNAPILTPDIHVRNEPGDLITNLKVGDTVPIRIDHGATQINDDFRITEIVLDPPTDTSWLSINATVEEPA